MENRFGFRDLVICILLVGMIVSVWVAMAQLDRHQQWLMKISEGITQQTTDLAQIRRAVEERSASGQDPSPATAAAPASASIGSTSNGSPSAAPAASAPTPAGPSTNGSASAPANGDAAEQGWIGLSVDPFRRIKAAQKLPGYAVGDNYVSAFAVGPDKLTPLISADAYSSNLQGYILESLAERDPDTLEWIPSLARGWRISPDGLVIEFLMRRGVTFSDGQPLTADDVVYTFNLMMDEKIEAPRARAYYQKIKSVEKVGTDRVVFTFKEPYFQAFELAGGMQVLSKAFYSKFPPAEFNTSQGLLIGSGPYRLPDPKNWKRDPGKPIELERNERYWGPTPPFDRMIFRVIENEAARLTTFRNGDMDSLGPTPEQYNLLKADKELLARTQHFEFDDPGAGYLYVGWNQKRNGKPTVLADKRVRQALTMLIDRESICKNMFYGYASVSTGPFGPFSKQNNKAIQPWPYDVARALALLKEAGFVDRNGDGILESPDGKPLTIELAFPSSGELFRRVVLFIKDTCSRAGVNLEPKPTEWAVLLQRIERRDFDAISLGWSGSIEGDLYQIFHSSQIEGSGDNSTSYANPELDKIIDEARSTVDEAKRMPLWHRAHQILHEDQPYTFLTVRKSLFFAQSRMKNIQRVATGLNARIEWFVPADLRRWTPAAKAP